MMKWTTDDLRVRRRSYLESGVTAQNGAVKEAALFKPRARSALFTYGFEKEPGSQVANGWHVT